MRFTKLGHSCVRLDKDGATLVIDPGTFSDAPAALDGAAAVLVTHEHPDHLDADAIRAALSSDPGVTLWANQSICAQFAPWLKAGEMIDYFRAVAPARGYAIHDAILNGNGLGLMTRMMSVAAAPSGAQVARLEPGTSLDL